MMGLESSIFQYGTRKNASHVVGSHYVEIFNYFNISYQEYIKDHLRELMGGYKCVPI